MEKKVQKQDLKILKLMEHINLVLECIDDMEDLVERRDKRIWEVNLDGWCYHTWRYSRLLAQLVPIPFVIWLPYLFSHFSFDMEPYHQYYLSTDVNDLTTTVPSYFTTPPFA